MTAPLDGIRVVELAGWMAGPGAAAMMADLGADVIKVEPLHGDAMRGATRQPELSDADRAAGKPAVDASFQNDNRGKRGIAVAVNTPQGADLVRRLVAGADVFLSNLLPARQAKYGLDSEALFAVNPRLVHATLTGYGVTGPDATRPGYDITAYFGRGAIVHSMSEPGSQAPRVRPAVGDHTAALSLLASILAALRLVEHSGQGQVVDVSLYATAAWAMSTDLAATLVDGKNPPSTGRRGRPHALHGAFKCADDRWVLLFMPEPRWWPLFCTAVGREEWIADERFATYPVRKEHMSELTDVMDVLFAERSLAAWGELLDAHRFIWAPASTVAEFAEDPQANELGFFPTIEHPSGSFRTVGAPFNIAGTDVGPRGPAPELGQHTADVLAELGVPAEEVDTLVANGVLGRG
ncbi:MAG TPA: CoA transferase [Frankiaceae bacterium]|nr:CoA transferase [Frankiaceae bacterium]